MIAAVKAYINVQHSSYDSVHEVHSTSVHCVSKNRRKARLEARRKKMQFHFERISLACSVRWEPGSFNKLNFIGLLLVGYFALCGSSPRQEDFPHGGGEENFLMSPHHNVWSSKSLANMVKENAVTTGPGRCLLIVLLVSFGQGFHHGAQHLDRPL